jgi:hypothetical protein
MEAKEPTSRPSRSVDGLVCDQRDETEEGPSNAEDGAHDNCSLLGVPLGEPMQRGWEQETTSDLSRLQLESMRKGRAY